MLHLNSSKLVLFSVLLIRCRLFAFLCDCCAIRHMIVYCFCTLYDILVSVYLDNVYSFLLLCVSLFALFET